MASAVSAAAGTTTAASAAASSARNERAQRVRTSPVHHRPTAPHRGYATRIGASPRRRPSSAKIVVAPTQAARSAGRSLAPRPQAGRPRTFPIFASRCRSAPVSLVFAASCRPRRLHGSQIVARSQRRGRKPSAPVAPRQRTTHARGTSRKAKPGHSHERNHDALRSLHPQAAAASLGDQLPGENARPIRATVPGEGGGEERQGEHTGEGSEAERQPTRRRPEPEQRARLPALRGRCTLPARSPGEPRAGRPFPWLRRPARERRARRPPGARQARPTRAAAAPIPPPTAAARTTLAASRAARAARRDRAFMPGRP